MNKIKTIISGLSSKLTLSNVFAYLAATYIAYFHLLQPALDVWTGKNSVLFILFLYVFLAVFLAVFLTLLAVVRNLFAPQFSPSEKQVLGVMGKVVDIAIFIVFAPLFFLLDIFNLCSLLGFKYGIVGFIAVPLWLALSWCVYKILCKVCQPWVLTKPARG